LRPDRLLDERFFAGCLSHGASDDGGRDDVEESRPKRRSSSTIRSACSAITRRCCTTTDSSSRTRASNRSTNASNDSEPDTPRSSQATAPAPVATRRDHQPAEQLPATRPGNSNRHHTLVKLVSHRQLISQPGLMPIRMFPAAFTEPSPSDRMQVGWRRWSVGA
jgi:hypothetical protein